MGSVIDLTCGSSPPPQGEPPCKRRRVDHAPPRSRSLKACIREQVLPHVTREVKKLPHGRYRLGAIAEDVIIALAKTSHFRERLDETRGFLTPQDESELTKKAALLVQQCSSREEFRSPSLPSSESSRSTEDESPDTIEPIRRTHTTGQQLSAAIKSTQPQHEPRPPTPKLPARNLRQRQTSIQSNNLWFQLKHRPYLAAEERHQMRRGAARLKRASPRALQQQPAVYHVDFTPQEVAEIMRHVNWSFVTRHAPTVEGLERVARSLLADNLAISAIVSNRLKGRNSEDVRNFCSDLLAGKVTPASQSRVLSLGLDTDMEPEHPQGKSGSRISSLLLARELEGNHGFGRMRRYENFQNEFRKAREDGCDVIAEFTNCAGDIATISWVSDHNLVCGTTAHSDSHNQQYNKPGNLLLCSMAEGTLQAFPDHRIPRPRVEKGENSTEAMRRSQDPWLYSSVVSSDYDAVHQRAYTSSFDKTVKVWKVDRQGKSMELLGTWRHEGNVNFVAVAKDGSGRVATASDVSSEAVRIYTVNPDNIDGSPYESFSCTRSASETDKWAYYPATMQWGRAARTQHLLVVGYSPRSMAGDDSDIPEEKRNSGGIVLWDANVSRSMVVTNASAANVFEVQWHPTLPRFICATSPCGLNVEHSARTQIHLFQEDKERKVGDEPAYLGYQSLDCMASDINELTIMPNSLRHAYVTAACTDGCVYVWDTARQDKPIHILKHDESLDGFEEDHREKLDTGVKFTAWGATPDRFYTGSSDGVVKVWNVRNPRRPFVRTLLEAPGPISSGAFSPDVSKLAIGDATGRLFLLSLDKRDEPEKHYRILPGSNRKVRLPMPFKPHKEPPPPERDPDAMELSDDHSHNDSGDRIYFDTGQLISTGNPVIGIVQGPDYASMGMFRREAHENEDPSRPLLTAYERQQKQSLTSDRGMRRRSMMRLKGPPPPDARLKAAHDMNCAKDLDVNTLVYDEVAELARAGALLSLDGEEGWDFVYEDMAKSELSNDDDRINE